MSLTNLQGGPHVCSLLNNDWKLIYGTSHRLAKQPVLQLRLPKSQVLIGASKPGLANLRNILFGDVLSLCIESGTEGPAHP